MRGVQGLTGHVLSSTGFRICVIGASTGKCVKPQLLLLLCWLLQGTDLRTDDGGGQTASKRKKADSALSSRLELYELSASPPNSTQFFCEHLRPVGCVIYVGLNSGVFQQAVVLGGVKPRRWSLLCSSEKQPRERATREQNQKRQTRQGQYFL